MSSDHLPSLAETNPALHRGVGESLCAVADAINASIGPVETARTLFLSG